MSKWIVSLEDDWMELQTEDGQYKASVKKDGCIEFSRIHNIGTHIEDEQQMHLCDIDDTIQVLQNLRNKIMGFIE